MGLRRDKIIEPVRIVDIADKGKAIGRDEEGHVYLVDQAVPGDIVRVKYRKKRKGLRIGKLDEVIKLSDYRVKSECRHFNDCGGCKWQHLDYKIQLELKEKGVKECLRRIGGIDPVNVRPIVPCEETYWYRNKLEYSFSSDRWLTREEIDTGNPSQNYPALGFHAPGHFQKVVDIEQCHLQPEPSNSIRNFVRDYSLRAGYSFYNQANHSGFLRNLVVRTSGLDESMVVLIFGEDQQSDINTLLNELRIKFPGITSLNYVINEKRNDSWIDREVINFAGPPYFHEKLCGIRYRIGPKSFFQTNSAQASKLLEQALEYSRLKGHETVFDLYCGIGTFGLYLARHCKQVIGIEEVEEAVGYAETNGKINGIENIRFYTGDVGTVLIKNEMQNLQPQIVLVDPPRAGLHPEIVKTLIRISPERIIYISCNPSTQARDIRLMAEEFVMEESTPVDMFPHTHHIENICLLKKRKI